MRTQWEHRWRRSNRDKAHKAPMSTHLWGQTTHPSNKTCPWCGSCVQRRMTPPKAPREITRSGGPEGPAKLQHREWRAGEPAKVAAKETPKPWNPELWMVNLLTRENVYAVLRLMDYPSWQ